MTNEERLSSYRSVCEHYLENADKQNRHLFYEHIPTSMVSTEYDSKISLKKIEWKGDSVFGEGKYAEGLNAGSPYITYKESCKVRLLVIIRTSIYFPIEFETDIEFYVEALKKGNEVVFYPYAHTDYSRRVTRFQELTGKTQERFGLTTIGEQRFDNETAFSFFADITRKARNAQPRNDTIKDHSYLEQLEQAHGEIAVYIAHLLTYLPFVDDLLGRKVMHEGDVLYLPNVNHYSYQFFMLCTSSFERLYTFWETLIVLPFNYDSLGLDLSKTPSFGQYFRKIVSKLSKKESILFNPNSANLQWLQQFFTGDYNEILEFRHRFVHHQFTADHEGLLTAKYSINAYQNIGNKQVLQKLNDEIKGMPALLIRHFHHCAEGFKRMLYLIDELA